MVVSRFVSTASRAISAVAELLVALHVGVENLCFNVSRWGRG